MFFLRSIASKAHVLQREQSRRPANVSLPPIMESWPHVRHGSWLFPAQTLGHMVAAPMFLA